MSIASPFDGICKGGPWDGQRYRHWSDTVPVMKPAATGPGLFTREPQRTTIGAVKFGEYRYDGYGMWRWIKSP